MLLDGSDKCAMDVQSCGADTPSDHVYSAVQPDGFHGKEMSAGPTQGRDGYHFQKADE